MFGNARENTKSSGHKLSLSDIMFAHKGLVHQNFLFTKNKKEGKLLNIAMSSWYKSKTAKANFSASNKPTGVILLS